MIEFNDINKEIPYLLFKKAYDESLNSGQKNIEAICISSFSHENNEVNARFVNLKFVNNKEFIFFSNYDSPKAQDFDFHDQITALIYWNNINTQIRMKAHIKKTDSDFNKSYFAKRNKKKNALAISSNQSMTVESYDVVEKNYIHALEKENLTECPDYWGGFSFIPYYFEFWLGHESRLNKREVFEINNEKWKHKYIQP